MERRGLNVRKYLLKSIFPLLRALPPRVASTFVANIGRTEYTLLKGVRIRVDQAVQHGSHHFGRTWDINQVGRELAGNQIRWRTRDQLLDGLPDDRVAPLFRVTGREHIDSILAEKRGLVLLCNHFGSHMMPAHWLLRNAYPLRLFMERPRHISRFLASQFDTDGPTGQKKLFISRKASPAEAAGSIMRAAQVLRAGMILMIAGDVRWPGPQTSPATFLGRQYTFSNTWVKLAGMTGAPIVPVFCRIESDGHYALEFQESFSIPRGTPDADQLAFWVQSYLRTIEAQVEAYPENSNDYFFWTEGLESTTSVGTAAT
ncbi:MAG: lysophospholipid acyltransferase family protein [Isosphaeraceae bacterium]